ncbi:methyl-accepting chemotaxis protein [Pseudoxanthomonas sp.]|jgi:methyl-accepting chemotaxis protein|uniref:methyl-accepting chemotaxis protein n=1 Tax=Pseudoxanthomonas sp. TaxID=1871049 RepID=UPI002E14179A|nr:methyl-accepting chemotaxis protein [Pseudoxanthomonas sp.]
MAAIEDRQAERAASEGTLPDAPVGLVRLDAAARVVAANRAAWDLLALSPDALLGQPCEQLWGLPVAVLNDEEGTWCAPGNDPARRIRYQADRDGEGWLLSLPHPETAALLRDATRLAQGERPVAVTPPLRDLAQRLADAATERALLERIGGLLGGCDLDLALPDAQAAHPLSRQIAAGFGNLAEAIRQAVALSVQVAAEVPHLVGDNDELLTQSQAQVTALDTVLDITRRLLQGLKGAGEELQAVIAVAASADASARQGVAAARQLGDAMREVERRSARAGDVIEVIDAVAFQTNILSINASIEAARAGPAGRGFAVVATEIRRLAEQAATAARDVRVILDESGRALTESAASAEATGEVLVGIGDLLARASQAMESVVERVSAQDQEVIAIDAAVDRVAALSRSNLEHADQVAARGTALAQGTDTLRDCVGLFRLPADPLGHRRHARVRDLAQDAAVRIGEALALALGHGRIGEDALFSRDYAPIPGIEPAKFTTPFDALCDELLPPLQEPVAARHPWIVFAICANPDGYVPTHNLRFTQPLTGDRAQDLVGNRTKRIFADRVGRSVGAHTDPYRLQVYRRDTGQIMFDLSVPVFVAGRHWGGFRVGYTLE